MGRVYLTSNFRSTLLADSLAQIETVFQQLEDQINAGTAVASLNDVNRKLPQGMRSGDVVFDLQGGELRIGIYNGASVQYVSFGSFTGAITDAQHGNRAGGSLHPVATTSVAGFMSAADKVALNAAFTLPALTSGSIIFSNGTTLAQDNSNFFWDDTNNRLGIGINAPLKLLHLKSGSQGTRYDSGAAFRFWDIFCDSSNGSLRFIQGDFYEHIILSETGDFVTKNLGIAYYTNIAQIHIPIRTDLRYIGMMSDIGFVWRSVATGNFFSVGAIDTGLYRDSAGVVKTTVGDPLAGAGIGTMKSKYQSSDGSAGLSVTITTAALTGGGTQGSMTFKDGILTAQTAAT